MNPVDDNPMKSPFDHPEYKKVWNGMRMPKIII